MRDYQKTLLAGVAALSLMAGTGLASAQQSKEHAGGSQAASPQAGQSMNRGGSQAQEKGKSTQTQAQTKGKATETQAQEKGKTNANRTAQTGKEKQTGKENMNPGSRESQNKMGKRGTQAENQNKPGSKKSNTAERQRTLKGLQGNTTKPMQGENKEGSTSTSKTGTSNQAQKQPQNGTETNENARVNGGGGAQVQGGNVQLSEQQRTQIRTTVINGRNAPRVGHVDFDVRVGTAIPRGKIHIVQVPETLVRIEPRWRGFLYFVYEDEIVIVDPHDYKIVAVVSA